VNSKQKKTLSDNFFKPTKNNISWDNIEKLMVSLGAVLRKGISP